MGWKPEHGGLKEICETGHAPGVRGLDSGPGNKPICFDRPQPLLEAQRAYKVMEENGLFRDKPYEKQMAEFHLKKLKEQTEAGKFKTVDYQKEGHPLAKE